MPDPSIGDTWSYRTIDLFTDIERSQYVHELIERTADGFKYKGSDPNSGRVWNLFRTRTLEQCTTSRDIKERTCGGAFRFPMSVGMTHSFEKRPIPNGYGYISEECEVTSIEKVTVVAGIFDTFKVECIGTWTSDFGTRDAIYRGRIVETHWYAPSINANAKSIYRHYRRIGGVDNQILTELLEFKRQ